MKIKLCFISRIFLLSIFFLIIFPFFTLSECLSPEECQAAFSEAPTSENFQQLPNPTYLDLQKLPNPTITDFQKLSVAEQGKYIQNSRFEKSDQPIAREYFSTSASHVNNNKNAFSRYIQTYGTEITIKGSVVSFDRAGLLKGRDINAPADRRDWSINLFVEENLYNYEVDSDGALLIQNNPGGEKFKVTGSLNRDTSTYTLTLPEGTINGYAVRNAVDIDFTERTLFLTAEEFGGLAFEKLADLVFDSEEQSLMIKNDAKVISFEEGRQLRVSGNILVAPENFGNIKGKLIVPPQSYTSINTFKFESRNKETILVFQPDHFLLDGRLPPLQGKNSIVFTPSEIAVEGEGIGFSMDPETLSQFTKGPAGTADFDLIIQKGRAVLVAGENPRSLQILAQGRITYQGGPQRFILNQGKVARFFTRSIAYDLGLPTRVEFFDEQGEPTGEVHQINPRDFTSYQTKGRKVLSSMGSSLESLKIMKTIAAGDPAEIEKINQRIDEITSRWDTSVEPTENELKFIEGVYKSLMAGSRVIHGSEAARTLYHYLEASGEPLNYDSELFLRRPEIEYAMKEMQQEIVAQVKQGREDVSLSSAVVKDKEGSEQEGAEMEKTDTSKFGKVKEGVIWTPDKELRYSFGNFYLNAKAERRGDSINVEWTVDDIYDYERMSRKDIVIPTGQLSSVLEKVMGKKSSPPIKAAGVVPVSRSSEEAKTGKGTKAETGGEPIAIPDRLAAYLTDVGRAKEFEMRARWQSNCNIQGECALQND